MAKRMTAILMIIAIFIMALPVGAAADIVAVEPISKGISYTNIKRETSAGLLNINVIKADLNEPGLQLKTLVNQSGLNKAANVSTLAKQYNTVAAINTDFFSWLNGGVLAEGMIISDGELLTSPSADPIYATIAQKKDDSVFFDYFTYNITVKSKRTEQAERVHYYNKDGQDMYMQMFDRNFGNYAPDSMDDAIEIVVENGVVTDILSNKPAVEIPEDGYVIKNSLRYSLFLAENFQIGDEVEISFDISPDTDEIKEATGGGTVLLKDGEKFPYTHNVSGRHPRTAVGTDKSGKIIYLVAVDGRQKSSVGMTLDELTAFMQEIGAYNAINCDGGGSTQMVAKFMGEENAIVNSPSEKRLVAAGLGIVAESGKGEFAHVRTTASSESIQSGSPVDIWVRGYDEYGNEVDLSGKPLNYSSNKKGKFEGNVYYPYETGVHTITVTAGGISGMRNIEVYEQSDIDDVFKKVDGNYNFGIFGSDNENLTVFTNFATAGRNKKANNMNIAAFRDIPEAVKSITFTVGKSEGAEIENALFVSKDNEKSGVMTDEVMLDKMKKTSKQNVFVLLPQKIDETELVEFKHFAKTELNGKKVYVVYFGEENTAKSESGIYFVSVCDVPSFDRNNFAGVLDKCRYLKISSDGKELGLSFESYLK